jgi:hypothetical protein
MTQFMRMLGALLLAGLMTACGGGGGSPGVTTSGAPTTTSTGTSTVAVTTTTAVVSPTLTVTDFALFTDKTTMNNSGADKAQLTVVAVDANRNVVPGAKVSVAANQNSVFIPSGSSLTDSSGTYLGTVSSGADKTDRDITVAVTINAITKQTAVRVAGSRLTLQAVPPSPAPGQSVALTVALVDSSGNPIPNATVKLGGTIAGLAAETMVTTLSGSATKSFLAPSTAGIYTISASGNGVNAADYQLQVFSSAIPPAIIPAGAVPSLSASPNVLAINAPGSATNKSTLRFLFLDAANQPIQNVRVRFSDVTTGLAAVGSSISSGTTTLFTDASGSVTAQYISGQNSSPTNGVTVKACYSANDFASGTCPSSITASMTVAGQALAVSVGDDNLLAKGPGTYIKRFAVTVADTAGRAVANAPVDISVDLTHYGKGSFFSPYRLANGNPVAEPISVVPQDLLDSYPSATTNPSTTNERVWCANEDINRNGNVDPGENIDGSLDGNSQATLEPRKSDLIVSYEDPTVTTTNASGILVIKVEYSQRFATWLAYKVRVTANVSGSQGMAERLFVTNFVVDDALNGSFHEPPYGTRSCDTAN